MSTPIAIVDAFVTDAPFTALGVLQFVIILALTGIILLAGRKLVYYRGA